MYEALQQCGAFFWSSLPGTVPEWSLAAEQGVAEKRLDTVSRKR